MPTNNGTSVSFHTQLSNSQLHSLYIHTFTSIMYNLGKNEFIWKKINLRKRNLILQILEQIAPHLQSYELSLLFYG
jgi:hypothetical protein